MHNWQKTRNGRGLSYVKVQKSIVTNHLSIVHPFVKFSSPIKLIVYSCNLSHCLTNQNLRCIFIHASKIPPQFQRHDGTIIYSHFPNPTSTKPFTSSQVCDLTRIWHFVAGSWAMLSGGFIMNLDFCYIVLGNGQRNKAPK